MRDDDLEPLEPALAPAHPVAAPAAAPARRWGWKGAAVALPLIGLLAAFVLTTGQLDSERDETDRLRRRLDRAEARTAQLAREADDLRRRTRLPGIDPEASAVVLLPPSGGMTAALSVLLAPEDFSAVWLRLDGAGAVPGSVHELAGGSCGQASFPPHDWTSGSAGPDGSVSLLAGPLRIDPEDADIWVRLRSSGQDLGGVRGPLVAPRLIQPEEPSCPPR